MANPYCGHIRVRFADTDANGHAFFGNYFVFADEVLGEYWQELGLDVADVVTPDFLTFTVNANMDFLGESLAGFEDTQLLRHRGNGLLLVFARLPCSTLRFCCFVVLTGTLNDGRKGII